MKNIIKLCALLSVLHVSSVAVGLEITWTNGSGDQDWFNAANWNMGVPSNADTAHVNSPAPTPATLLGAAGSPASVGRVVLDNEGELTIETGGTLDVVTGSGQPGQFVTGNTSTSTNSILNVDGQLNVAAEFAIGNSQGVGNMNIGATGEVNANGPWFIGGHDAGADGTITVDGGTLNVAGFMALGWNGTGTLNVNSGLVNSAGVINLGVNNAASNGDIVINGGEVISAGLNIGNNLGSGSLLMEDGAKYTNNGGFVQSPGSKVTINGSAQFEFKVSPLADVEALINGNPDWIFSGTPSITGSLGSVIVTNAVALTGDFDGDGDVDGADFLKWQQDGLSASDLNDWQTNYGAPPVSAVTAVPEPSSLLLLFAMFALTLVFISRKRRTSSLV